MRLQEKRPIFASPPCCFLRCPVLPELLGKNLAEPVSRKDELEAAEASLCLGDRSLRKQVGGGILLFRDFGSSQDCIAWWRGLWLFRMSEVFAVAMTWEGVGQVGLDLLDIHWTFWSIDPRTLQTKPPSSLASLCLVDWLGCWCWQNHLINQWIKLWFRDEPFPNTWLPWFDRVPYYRNVLIIPVAMSFEPSKPWLVGVKSNYIQGLSRDYSTLSFLSLGILYRVTPQKAPHEVCCCWSRGFGTFASLW